MSTTKALSTFVLLFTVFSLRGQETRGSLLGRVSDPSGAIMPGVSIEIVHTQMGGSTKTTTNQDGMYQALYLLPGMYKVTAQSSGFKTLVRDGIEIRINDRVELNLTMEVGAATERVEVVGDTPCSRPPLLRWGRWWTTGASPNCPCCTATPWRCWS